MVALSSMESHCLASGVYNSVVYGRAGTKHSNPNVAVSVSVSRISVTLPNAKQHYNDIYIYLLQ